MLNGLFLIYLQMNLPWLSGTHYSAPQVYLLGYACANARTIKYFLVWVYRYSVADTPMHQSLYRSGFTPATVGLLSATFIFISYRIKLNFPGVKPGGQKLFTLPASSRDGSKYSTAFKLDLVIFSDTYWRWLAPPGWYHAYWFRQILFSISHSILLLTITPYFATIKTSLSVSLLVNAVVSWVLPVHATLDSSESVAAKYFEPTWFLLKHT